MTGCKHCIMKDIYEKKVYKDENGEVYATMNEHIGYRHLCDGGHQKEYDEWHERNKDNTYDVYKKDFMECYDPNEFAAALNSMIDIANEILEKSEK